MLLRTQPLAQKTDDGREWLLGVDFEDALRQVRGGADGLEADGY